MHTVFACIPHRIFFFFLVFLFPLFIIGNCFWVGGSFYVNLLNALKLKVGAGLVMIMLVDMNVKWGVGLDMLKKGLMAGTWVALVDIKVVHLVHAQIAFGLLHFKYGMILFAYSGSSNVVISM